MSLPASDRQNESWDEHPQVAVAIGGPTNDQALRAYDAVAGRAGIAELRLDMFTERPDLERLIQASPCPVVATCRAQIEGGSFQGSEEERLGLLRDAAAFGARFVDVERFAFRALGPITRARIIVSQHDFIDMPRDLCQRWTVIRDLGADVVKVAGMARDAADIVPVLDVLAQADRPTIAMAMGPAGVASRIVALRYGCCVLSYASLDHGAQTAPGQIGLRDMLQTYRAPTITQATRFYGLIAPSVQTELIVAFNRALQSQDLDAVCVPLPTTHPDAQFLTALARHGFAGFHVHGPGQQSLSDQLKSTLKTLNSLTVQGDELVTAHVKSPEAQVELWLS